MVDRFKEKRLQEQKKKGFEGKDGNKAYQPKPKIIHLNLYLV